jgi:hypothetical protein
MRMLCQILIVVLVFFTSTSLFAQEKWAMESVFLRNRLPAYLLANDFIAIRSKPISEFRFFGLSEPSFQFGLRDSKYNYYAEPYSNTQSEYNLGLRWLKFDSYQKGFLGDAQLEAWLSFRPKTQHYLSAQKQHGYKNAPGDTIENYLYSARLYRKQIGVGAAYSKQIYANKRWRVYTGIQLGYQIEYGRGELSEFISDALITVNPNDSNQLYFEGFNMRSQTISIDFAPTHILISGFQLGTECKLHKRIQLFYLFQTQLLFIRNSEAKGRFARGLSIPASFGVRYLLKAEKARIFD